MESRNFGIGISWAVRSVNKRPMSPYCLTAVKKIEHLKCPWVECIFLAHGHLPVYLYQNMYGYQRNAGNHSVSKETVLHFYFFRYMPLKMQRYGGRTMVPLKYDTCPWAGKGQVERRPLKPERGSYNIRNRKDCCL